MSVSDSLDKNFAPAWRPNPGDKLIGRVIELREREGQYGRYPIVTVRTAAGDELAVHAFHEVLSTELAQVAPAVGDEIGIKYLGKHPERDYHQYRVRRAGGAAGFHWSAYGEAAEPAATSEIPTAGTEEDDDAPF